jgi:hypothetical protein
MKKLLVAAMVLLFSCENGSSDSQAKTDVELAMQKLSAQGFHTENAVIENGKIIIDGDMVFTPKHVLQAKESRNKQWHTTYLVSDANIASIKFRFDSNVPQAWKDATQFAFDRWNAISGSAITMYEVSTGEDIFVTYKRLRSRSTIASASFPDGAGRVGSTITINTSNDGMATTYKNFTMTHEIGHCIGFRHTNWFDRNSDGDATTNDNEGVSTVGAEHIPGTPAYELDPNSVMNAIVQQWLGFSEFDEVSAQYMYPGETGVVPDPPLDGGGGDTGGGKGGGKGKPKK